MTFDLTISDKNINCKYCNRLLTSIQISRHQKFCSPVCKSKSQEVKISLTCDFCGREFSINPYLKRKNNYCSRKCYLNSTRRKKLLFCEVCGKEFKIKAYLVNKGFGKYCTKECQFSVYERKRVKITCKKCGKEFLVPPSVAKKKKFCSKKCRDDYKRDYVRRLCKNCKRYFFIPRWELEKGKGTFCSRKCFQEFQGETSIEASIRRALGRRKVNFEQEVRFGKYFADFLISDGKIIIECDGDYWHKSSKSKERDKRKDEFFIKNGYRIFRFTEKEIKESPQNCVAKVLES